MFISILLFLTSTLPASPAEELDFGNWPLFDNAAAARRAIFSGRTAEVRFEFTATVTFPHLSGFPYLAVRDKTGNFISILNQSQATKHYDVGDRLHLIGRSTKTSPIISDAYCERVDFLGRGTNIHPTVRHLSARQLVEGIGDCSPVCLSGILTHCFPDDATPSFLCLVLESKNISVYCTLCNPSNLATEKLKSLVGTCVSVTGLCHPCPPSPRFHAEKVIFIQDPNDIRSAPGMEDTVFDAPDIDTIRTRRFVETLSLGRHKTTGYVLTSFQDGNLLLKTKSGAMLRAHLVGPILPPLGSIIEILGVPAPDLYHATLIHAIWRKLPPDGMSIQSSNDVVVSSHDLGDSRLRPKHLGVPVHVVGTLVRLQGGPGKDRCLFIDDGLQLVKAVIDTNTKIPEGLCSGCIVETTGICVLENTAGSVRDGYAKLQGFFLAPIQGQTVCILKRPAWWTVRRLLITLSAVGAAALVVFIWNLLLKTSIRRKSKQLAQEASKRISADIKVLERTRLAVELHDALSQTLTGVSMEIRAANKALMTDTGRCQTHLVRAERTVDVCRGELRNCIWDLRNNAMDDMEMNEAIRRTLAPHLGTASLSVRFLVPRERFSDNTTHAILRIIRELTVNAIRHGHATDIRVAGTIDSGYFIFSVRDNGCGFDPKTAPGIENGHFGLQGIRERVEAFEGTLEISSSPTNGTKVTISLSIPKEDLS